MYYFAQCRKNGFIIIFFIEISIFHLFSCIKKYNDDICGLE